MAESIPGSGGELALEIEKLRAQLEEAQDVIRAIQSGAVDALVVSGPQGEQIFTLQGSEYSYRALVEAMNEGAATLSTEGIVLYCNQRLADLTGIPEGKIIGAPVAKLVHAESLEEFRGLFANALAGDPGKVELSLKRAGRKSASAYVSLRRIEGQEPSAVCMVVTDLTEHKKRDELIAAGELSRSILASAGEAIAVCDNDGTIISTNEALTSLCGFSPLFQPFDTALRLEIIRVASGAVEPFSVVTALRDEGLRAQEVRFHRADGKVLSLLLSSGRVSSPSGIVGCVLTMSDITDRKRAEEALLLSERRYRSLFESMDEGFCVIEIMFDENGRPNDWRYVEVNPAFERHNGLEQAIGKTMRELVPDIEASWFELYGRVAVTGEPIRLVKFSRALDRWFDLYVVRVGEPEQHRVAVFFRNITKQKQADEALRAERDFTTAILDTASALVVVLDEQGRITRFNRACEALTGYNAADACGRPIWEFVPPEEMSGVRQIWDALCAGAGPNKYENHWVTKDGLRRLISWSNTTLVGTDGTSQYVVGIGIDVTDHRKAEEVLIRTEKLAALGRMAATIAHEVNNPLAAATNAIYIATSDAALSAQARSALEIADQELRRAAHITARTLGFYKDQNARTPVELPNLIDEIVSLYARKLQERKIKVHRRYTCCACPQACFTANAGELRQVISNLLMNGIDALTDNGTLYIRLARFSGLGKNGEVMRLTIADNGSGIRTEHLQRVFEPFFTTKESVGTGLGLWISQQIIGKYGGSIRIRSQQKKGTVCCVTIPAMPMNTSIGAPGRVGHCAALHLAQAGKTTS